MSSKEEKPASETLKIFQSTFRQALSGVPVHIK
jgi:hypothetical protein